MRRGDDDDDDAHGGAVAALVAALQSPAERVNRAAMHGLAAAGQAAVPALLRLVDASAAALGDTSTESGHSARLLMKQAMHALAEALVQPDLASVTTMVRAAEAARSTLLAWEALHPSGEARPHGSPDRSATKAHSAAAADPSTKQRQQVGGGRAAPEQLRLVAAELRQIVATGMQALGCVAERAVLRSDVATCAAIADCLLDCAGSEEVGSGSGGTPDAATAIPELARESAAHGLIRLASNGRNALDEISVHRAAVTGCDVSGNHRHHFFVCGFATEAALRCSEGEQTETRRMLGRKIEQAAATSEFWATVCTSSASMFRGAAIEDVTPFWQASADPFGQAQRGWDRHGLTEFVAR